MLIESAAVPVAAPAPEEPPAPAPEPTAAVPVSALRVLLVSNAYAVLAATPWAELDNPPYSDTAKATLRQLSDAQDAGRAALLAATGVAAVHPNPLRSE